LEFSTSVCAPESAKADCVVVGLFDGQELSPSAQRLDRACGGMLKKLAKNGDLPGKAGTNRVLYDLSGISSPRLVLMGLGNKANLGPKEYQDAVRKALAIVGDTGSTNAWFYFTELPVVGRDATWKARHLAMTAADATYRFEETKSKKSNAAKLKSIVLAHAAKSNEEAVARGAQEGDAIAKGMELAKNLGNLPGNICTPTYLARTAENLQKSTRLSVEILERKDMQALGMGALLSVAAGSRQPPKFIIIKHAGATKKDRPIVLVGKGITFDTGGISLKPGGEMDEMKFDMCGGAAVFGSLLAADAMKLPINLIGIVPATENMPGGAATKPGDIVTTMSGQTVEILNTDAEGRLILCDALTYAERFNPETVIDIATLTGACVIALGHVCSGLFSNSDALADELLSASTHSWDRAWRLPLWEDYQDQLKSNFADFANIGGRPAGSVTAACFLARFTRKLSWAHLDIAGIAWKSGKEKGATGRPVPLLTEFLLQRARAASRSKQRGKRSK
jgi:leucyl aminopeptidase